MIFGGVWVEDRVVRELAPLVERPLGRRLEQALLFRAQVVALTRDEKAAVLSALERAPRALGEVRDLFSLTRIGTREQGGSTSRFARYDVRSRRRRCMGPPEPVHPRLSGGPCGSSNAPLPRVRPSIHEDDVFALVRDAAGQAREIRSPCLRPSRPPVAETRDPATTVLEPFDRPYRHIGCEHRPQPRVVKTYWRVGQTQHADQVAFDSAGIAVDCFDALEPPSARAFIGTH